MSEGESGARWLADPSGRHELRFWTGSSWSLHVCDGTTVDLDPIIPDELPAIETRVDEAEPASLARVPADISLVSARDRYVTVSPSPPPYRRDQRIYLPPSTPTAGPSRRPRVKGALLAVTILVVIVGAGVLLVPSGPDRDDRYIAALESAGVRSQLGGQPMAVTYAKNICDQVDKGGGRKGYLRDKIAVEFYCPTFAQDFEVLPSPEELAVAYLAELESAGLRDQFANDAAAVANAQRACSQLEGGSAPRGYARDAVGVKVYCEAFYDRFTVIPTPEEQRIAYLAALRSAGFAGKFSSDENAVAHGTKVCADMKNGGPQHGLPHDKIAVQVYCPDFLDGFKLLRTLTLTGFIVLQDDTPDARFPAIGVTANTCTGQNDYLDISEGTPVTVRNASGRVLDQSALSIGYGTRTACAFSFPVTVSEGEDLYLVEVSDRGSVALSFTELDINGIRLSLRD